MREIYSLRNKKLSKVGRASNMYWMLFGRIIEKKDSLGRIVEKGEYAIHIQCPWRIIDIASSSILVASNDIYEPSSTNKVNEKFDWEIAGSNLFDERIKKCFTSDAEAFVKKITISQNNDLAIMFTNNYQFECFTNTSSATECWRFIGQKNNEHMVAYGTLTKIE